MQDLWKFNKRLQVWTCSRAVQNGDVLPSMIRVDSRNSSRTLPAGDELEFVVVLGIDSVR
uniref:Uncharacterized protein n=1 Tax=Fervidicoccus fontis TaxID=683846 RepID=A0A7J3ZKQ1_9CREN